jgi:hypothetical protein
MIYLLEQTRFALDQAWKHIKYILLKNLIALLQDILIDDKELRQTIT